MRAFSLRSIIAFFIIFQLCVQNGYAASFSVAPTKRYVIGNTPQFTSPAATSPQPASAPVVTTPAPSTTQASFGTRTYPLQNTPRTTATAPRTTTAPAAQTAPKPATTSATVTKTTAPIRSTPLQTRQSSTQRTSSTTTTQSTPKQQTTTTVTSQPSTVKRTTITGFRSTPLLDRQRAATRTITTPSITPVSTPEPVPVAPQPIKKVPAGFGVRTYPLLDRNRPTAAAAQQTPNTNPAAVPQIVAPQTSTAQKPVTLIKAFQTGNTAVPGPRNQASPAAIAASLSKQNPQQQVETLNSLSPFNAAKVLSNLDQGQLDQIMSQPGLNSDLLGQLQQFITPESCANLTKTWDTDRIASSLQYPDLTPEARGKILQNTPQASGVFKGLIQDDPQAAMASFQNLTRAKQSEILSQLDAGSLTSLLATGENHTFFSLLSTENKKAVLANLSETDPALARSYLYDNARPVANTDISVSLSRLSDGSQNDANHPALLVNGLNAGQLKKLLTSLEPAVVATILADPQLNAKTRALIVDNFQKTLSDPQDTADPLRSANIDNNPLSPQEHFVDMSISIYSALDPEGTQELLQTLSPAIETSHSDRRKTIVTDLCGMDRSSAGELLARSDITAVQTAALLKEATSDQREKLLSALGQTDPQKAKQTREMLSLMQRAEQQKANEAQQLAQVRSDLKKAGPQAVAAWLAKNNAPGDIEGLFIMDDKFIDQTIAYLEKSSPATAAAVKQQRTKAKEQANSTPSDEDTYKALLARTPKDTALIIAETDARTAREILEGLKQRDDAYAEKTLKELGKLDYQLAKETQEPAPAAARLSQNQFGQIIKIEGEDVYSVLEYPDGTVRMSKIGKLGDSPETIEALPGQSFSEENALRPIRTSALTKSVDGTDDPSQADYDPSQHDVSYDPANDALVTPYAVYPHANVNKPSNWKVKQTFTMANGTRVTSVEPVSRDSLIDTHNEEFRAGSEGTKFVDDKNNEYAIVVTDEGTRSLQPVGPIQYKKGTTETIRLSDGTTRTLTAETDFSLTRNTYEDGYAGEYHMPATTVFRDENNIRWSNWYGSWKQLDFDASDIAHSYTMKVRLAGETQDRVMIARDPVHLQASDLGRQLPQNTRGYSFLDAESGMFWVLNGPTPASGISDGNGNLWLQTGYRLLDDGRVAALPPTPIQTPVWAAGENEAVP